MRKVLLFSMIAVACASIAVSQINRDRNVVTTVANVARTAPLQHLKLGTVVHPEGGAAVDLRVTNLSHKVAIAWVLTSRHFKEDGSEVSRSSKVVVVPEESNSGLAPGASWNGKLSIPSADGSAVDYDLALDYVLFSDRSSWGPDTLDYSRHIAGQMQARRVERSRLKGILERQGVQALAEELDE